MKEIYKYDWLVVGAGLFGATFAYLMHKAGKKVLLMDKRHSIAGNCYIDNSKQIPVHVYGPHIFHTSNRKTWEFVNQFVEFNRFTNCPKAHYMDAKNNIDKVYSLPFNMNTFYEVFGTTSIEDAKNKIEEEKKAYIGSPSNLEEQAMSLVGPTIYNTLIKHYTERQWGRPCDQLDPNIIKRLPLRYSWDNNYFNDKWQGVADYTEMISCMLDGCEVVLGEDYFIHREMHDNLAEHVLYTGALDEFYGYKFSPLEWRAVYWETWTDYPDKSQGVAVMNNVGPDGDFTRTIEHKYFNMMDGDNILTYNIFSKEYSIEWKLGCGYDPAYPIDNLHNNELYSYYKTLADAEKKHVFGGRLADYAYRNMDKTIEEAMNLYERVNGNKS